MTVMLDKVAQAIGDVDAEVDIKVRAILTAWFEPDYPSSEQWLKARSLADGVLAVIARAAIEAMLTPTEAMQIAGLGAGYDAAKPGLQRMEEAERAKGTDGWLAATVAVGAGAIYDAAYAAMIAAALEEQR